MTDRPQISRQEAKERVETADFGVVITGVLEPVPTIGEVDVQEFDTEVVSYEFGDWDCAGDTFEVEP